jgi:chemotaxis protein methyltransferase CheR
VSAPLHDVAELVRRESGIRLAEPQHDALRAALRRMLPGLEPGDFLRLAADPARRAGAIARLLDEVTIQESSFFREPAAFLRLDWRGLLAAAQASGQGVVRVWVAGCATGEEAYTLGMLACEAFAPERPPVTIVATDVSRRALDDAHAATYGARTLRDIGPERRARWLRPGNGGLTVREDVRRLVGLRRHNLVTEPAPPPGEAHFHVIACRNVLIYFDRPTAERIVEQLEAALAPGGVLVLGAADTLAGGGGRRPGAPAPARPPARSARQRPARPPAGAPTRDQRVARARAAADVGRLGDARDELARLVRRDPLDADAHALRGIVELAAGDAEAAIAALRRALYAEPGFGLAAFMLGQAHDAAGRPQTARAAYARALQSLEPTDERHAAVFGPVDITAIEAACRDRLAGGPR